MLVDFPPSFHESRHEYLQNLYETANPEDAFSAVLCYGIQKRLVVSAPVTLGRVTLRTPFLIDTGCYNTVLHTHAWNRFKAKFDRKPDIWPVGTAKIGTHTLSNIQNNTHTTERCNASGVVHVFGYLNILGMDFLTRAVPELPKYLSENISKFQPPTSDVWVNGGLDSFPVTPKNPDVASLKLAIKEVRMYALPYPDIKIRDPKNPGQYLRNKDPVLAGVEYTYDLPRSKT
jgi:hypothetical protein